MYKKSDQYIIYKQGRGKDHVYGLFNMILQGEVFRVQFSYGPGQLAVCTATKIKSQVPPLFDVTVSPPNVEGHKATVNIQVFPL